jgi:hypothetical protein
MHVVGFAIAAMPYTNVKTALTTNIGMLLSARGLLTVLAADNLRERVSEGNSGVELALRRYLDLRSRFVTMQETWRPFFEGLAVFLQTSSPCPAISEQSLPVITVSMLAMFVRALDPIFGFHYMDKMDFGLQSAAHDVLMQGAQLPTEGTHTLATTLEMKGTDCPLEYFLGHAYVRGLQARLMRKVVAFECPERFLPIMFQILIRSWGYLLDPMASQNPFEQIERLYGWLELLEQAPAERLQALESLDPTVDILVWLREGRLETIPEFLSDHLVLFLERMLSKDLEWFNPTTRSNLLNFVGNFLLHSYSLNLCTGGRCWVAGMVPNMDGSTHYLALSLGDTHWWLAVEDRDLSTLQLDPASLPQLPRDAYQRNGGPRAPEDAPELQVGCFLSYLRRSPKASEMVVVEFSAGDGQPTVVAQIQPGPLGRAILNTIGLDDGKERHQIGEDLRNMVTRYQNLNVWPDWLRQQGYPELSEIVHLAADQEQVSLAHLRDLWSERVLRGLLGREKADEVSVSIREGHLSAFLWGTTAVHLMVAGGYSVSCMVDGPGARDAFEQTEILNDIAQEKLGKPLFRWDDQGRVRYLGLWEP